LKKYQGLPEIPVAEPELGWFRLMAGMAAQDETMPAAAVCFRSGSRAFETNADPAFKRNTGTQVQIHQVQVPTFTNVFQRQIKR
jgi:hypothetical protein